MTAAGRVAPWQERAACRDLAVEMFPSVRDKEGQAAAKAVCRECPVVIECLRLGLAQDAEGRSEERWGVYGSLNGPQRGRLAARMRRMRELTRADVEAFEREDRLIAG